VTSIDISNHFLPFNSKDISCLACTHAYQKTSNRALLNASSIQRMHNLGRTRQYGKQLGGSNYLGTLSIHFFRDVNISIDIVSILDKDIRVWLAQMCSKFEQNRTQIDNFGKMILN
jgi:hypothetical protein